MNGKTKWIILLISLVVSLIGFVWALTWGNANFQISQINAELKSHETDNVISNSQLQEKINIQYTEIIQRLTRIESRTK